jgi:hypothetical protein
MPEPDQPANDESSATPAESAADVDSRRRAEGIAAYAS